MLDEPQRCHNFWFRKDNIYLPENRHPAVMASKNDVVLLDRRKIEAGELALGKSRHIWCVYNASSGRSFGSWIAYKTRGEAIRAWQVESGCVPLRSFLDYVSATVAKLLPL